MTITMDRFILTNLAFGKIWAKLVSRFYTLCGLDLVAKNYALLRLNFLVKEDCSKFINKAKNGQDKEYPFNVLVDYFLQIFSVTYLTI